MQEIKKVAVIGAGVMGAGIAAQVANAGVPVVLLDVVPGGAAKAVEKMLKTQPAPFMSAKAAKLITPGNTETDLGLVADCDWIIEAIIERLDTKQELYGKLETVRQPGSIVSSNTSTIPLASLVEHQSHAFAHDFCITHFFNPPRYMRLLEVVKGKATGAGVVESVSRFADVALGKTIVPCKDRPGFIANRLGIFWMNCAMIEAIDLGLEVEEADAVMGRPFGIPRTGVFGLMDLVGIDLGPHLVVSLMATLPQDDPFRAMYRDVPLIGKMIAEGYTGRKGKGGFYRLNRAQGGKAKEAISLKTGEYRPEIKPDLPALEGGRGNLKALMSGNDKISRYAARVMGQTLSYALSLVPEVADEIDAVDEAMRLGYNWKYGPFELADQLGADWLAEKLAAERIAVPPQLKHAAGRSFYRIEEGRRQQLGGDGAYHDIARPEGVILLADIKRTSKPLLKNASAAVWDIGDGVACFEFTSKMNALDPETMTLLGKAMALVKEKFKALVVYNEADNFSVGANVGLAMFAANMAAWDQIEATTMLGQSTYKALKYAPFPTVGAPSGMALGGGCEILLHCAHVQAHAETYMGLVEAGVGLLPGWGGCKEMLTRWSLLGRLPRGPMPPVAKVFELISTATVSKSAAEAKELLFLRPTDAITMNRNRLLADAKAKALQLARAYVPPKPVELTLPGKTAAVGMKLVVEGFHRRGIATDHDLVVAAGLATVLSGGDADVTKPVTEDELYALERKGLGQLVRTAGTLARIEHMLDTGKPLRN
ncbi:MAG: 3-hydroxyacyl-CoA dehydrogenase NAD-binding domain-containing protein [Beijerinckiaceae bacterium]